MSIAIRTATIADAALIADISRQTFYDTFAEHNTPADMQKFLDEQFTKEALMAEVGLPGSTFLLAYEGDDVAGYARLRHNTIPPFSTLSPALEIARIYVIKEMIGKGVGNALMQACHKLATEKGDKALWLGVWEKNKRAIDFYTQWGFEKVGEQEFVLGNDVQHDWVMIKEL